MNKETTLHIAVAELLDAVLMPEVMWTTRAAGNVKLTRTGAALQQRMGLKPGWPDIEIQCGLSFGIELKEGKGRLSKSRWVTSPSGRRRFVPGQEDVFPKLEAAGMKIAVCRSVDDVIAALMRWGIPMRMSEVGNAIREKVA